MKLLHGTIFLSLGLGLGFLTRPSPAPRVEQHDDAPVIARADRESSGLPLTTTFSHHDEPALPHAAPPTPEIERARSIVDDATARGVWTEADRESLREQLSTMPGDDQADVVARLASAINRGAVKVTPDGNLPL